MYFFKVHFCTVKKKKRKISYFYKAFFSRIGHKSGFSLSDISLSKTFPVTFATFFVIVIGLIWRTSLLLSSILPSNILLRRGSSKKQAVPIVELAISSFNKTPVPGWHPSVWKYSGQKARKPFQGLILSCRSCPANSHCYKVPLSDVWSKNMSGDPGSILMDSSALQQLEIIHVALLYGVDGLLDIFLISKINLFSVFKWKTLLAQMLLVCGTAVRKVPAVPALWWEMPLCWVSRLRYYITKGKSNLLPPKMMPKPISGKPFPFQRSLASQSLVESLCARCRSYCSCCSFTCDSVGSQAIKFPEVALWTYQGCSPV